MGTLRHEVRTSRDEVVTSRHEVGTFWADLGAFWRKSGVFRAKCPILGAFGRMRGRERDVSLPGGRFPRLLVPTCKRQVPVMHQIAGRRERLFRISASLSDFAARAAVHITGDEKGQAQIFLDRLFQAFGHGGSLELAADDTPVTVFIASQS